MKTKAIETFREILTDGADVHRRAAARALGAIGGPQSVAILIKSLLDEDPDVRTDAATALGRLRDPKSAAALMENLMGDPESDVKKAAIGALVAMHHEPVLPLLRKLAVSRSDEIVWDDEEVYSDGWDSWVDIQLMAIAGLAAFDDQASVPLIVEAMFDEMGQDISEQGVAALVALGKSGADALVVMLGEANARLHRQIAHAVAADENAHLRGLQEMLLADPTPQVRLITIGGLAPESPLLEPFFADESPETRVAAIRRAGLRFTTQIGGLVRDQSPLVRLEVYKRIAAAPDKFKSRAVIDGVKSGIKGDPTAAIQAALALVALRGEKVAKGFLHTLTAPEIPLEFRVGVVEALKKAGPVSIPAFLGAAGAPERAVRLAVLTALVDFAADDPVWPNAAGTGLLAALDGALVRPDEGEDQAADQAADQFGALSGDDAPDGEDMTPLSAEEMQEMDDSLPRAIVPGELQNAKPVEAAPITSTLSSIAAVDPTPLKAAPVAPPELSAQEQSMLALSKLPTMAKRKIALVPVVSPYLDVKRFAARLLGGVVNPEVTEKLVATLAAGDHEMRVPVLHSLVDHGEKTGSLPALARAPLEALIDDDTGASEARVLAVRAYGWLDGTQVDEKLHGLLSDVDPLIRVEALHALDHRGIADDAVLACLDDGYLGAQVAAANAIARLRGAQSVDALVAFAYKRDGTNRREIGQLLAKYAPKAGAARMLETLQDQDLRASWLVAIDALSEVFDHTDDALTQKVA